MHKQTERTKQLYTYIGKTIGSYTVLDVVVKHSSNKKWTYKLKCQCKCGKTAEVLPKHLLSDTVDHRCKSCRLEEYRPLCLDVNSRKKRKETQAIKHITLENKKAKLPRNIHIHHFIDKRDGREYNGYRAILRLNGKSIQIYSSLDLSKVITALIDYKVQHNIWKEEDVKKYLQEIKDLNIFYMYN